MVVKIQLVDNEKNIGIFFAIYQVKYSVAMVASTSSQFYKGLTSIGMISSRFLLFKSAPAHREITKFILTVDVLLCPDWCNIFA